MAFRLILTALFCLIGISSVLATPARIIILRHGEKADKWDLCDVGQERADALAANYLGRGAEGRYSLRQKSRQHFSPLRCIHSNLPLQPRSPGVNLSRSIRWYGRRTETRMRPRRC